MGIEQRITRLEGVTGSGEPPRVAFVTSNHPDLPTDPDECEAYLEAAIPPSVEHIVYIPDNGRDPNVTDGPPVRLH